MKKRIVIATCIAALLAGGAGIWVATRNDPAPSATPAPAAQPATGAPAIIAGLNEILDAYRKIIVLLADEKKLPAAEREPANRVGQALFHENLARTARLDEQVKALLGSSDAGRFNALGTVLDHVESGANMYDADRLAFREFLRALQQAVAADSSLAAVRLHKRIADDLEALSEIERNYEKEISQIFSRFETRAITINRERWEDYVAQLRKLYSRETILRDHGIVMPYPQAKEPPRDEKEETEIYGHRLPAKTVVLTFDDGPHRQYSEEISAILKQYGVPAIFFQVGRNIGAVAGDGKAKLAAGGDVSRKLKASGYELANHSYTHAQLSKQTGDAFKTEILNTDALLKAVDPKRSPLFRFPYGARNSEGLQALQSAQLKSVMWNIDSMDWADPVPKSIADRVLRAVDKEGRGIILFHDIHERTVKALPLVLDRLIADGYQFAGWDNGAFVTAKGGSTAVENKALVTTAYDNSWAVVVGVDKYTKFPALQYAVRDAQAVRQMLIEKFGFAPERVITLTDADATRNGILGAFHDKLVHGGVKKNDRVLVFFAGHGATRKLSSGRDVGYIVPVDADPNQLATDAIPMTEIQNIAENLTAKHVLFVMDACYSGLGLTRGSSNAFLRENAKRIGRQMLTAGGADQLVADNGPNGHSIFTWTLLQGLAGKADLNGDRFITATELAAYLAPAVASVSQQTPAFGSLPGSQGGEFVFELHGETEFLSAGTRQLSTDAIALNSKLDAARPAQAEPAPGKAAAVAPVVVKDLQGNDRQITPPPAAGSSPRQLAQRANDRGLQLYQEKRYAEAEAQFTEALKLRADFALAANNLGFVYYKQDKYAEAARWFENTVRIDPSRAIAYANLGDAYAKLGREADARKAYQRVAEIAPGGRAASQAAEKLKELGNK